MRARVREDVRALPACVSSLRAVLSTCLVYRSCLLPPPSPPRQYFLRGYTYIVTLVRHRLQCLCAWLCTSLHACLHKCRKKLRKKPMHSARCVLRTTDTGSVHTSVAQYGGKAGFDSIWGGSRFDPDFNSKMHMPTGQIADRAPVRTRACADTNCRPPPPPPPPIP